MGWLSYQVDERPSYIRRIAPYRICTAFCDQPIGAMASRFHC